MRPIHLSILLLSLLIVASCNQDDQQPGSKNRSVPDKSGSLVERDTTIHQLTDTWEKYWQAGKAEISSYHLRQARYGEIHDGDLVNIFVTEDFSKLKQVKLDEPEKAGTDRIKILKLNQAVKFVTGIYPYSLMLSTFSPLDINRYPHAVKITASAQEWCGQSFFQLNNRNNRFIIEQRSYFEKENDQDLSMEPVLLEDEPWNLIRIDPAKLPKGSQTVLPGALYFRLSHHRVEPVTATLDLSLRDTFFVYTISYPALSRTLRIHFEKSFPHGILSWSDTFPGTDGKMLTTTAIRNKAMLIDYWNRHSNSDKQLREALGLRADY